jgi:hypothetical protein
MEFFSIQKKNGDFNLKKGWTIELIKLVQEKNPYCVFVFKKKKFQNGNRKNFSNKHASKSPDNLHREKRGESIPFFQGEIICKMSGCLQYTYIIESEPKENEDVFFSFQSRGSFCPPLSKNI